MRESKYPTDLKDKEWKAIKKSFWVSYEKEGRPLKHSKREKRNTECNFLYSTHWMSMEILTP